MSNDESALEDSGRCCTQALMETVRSRQSDESGFMGLTHALSAVAIAAVVLAFAPSAFKAVFGTEDPWFVTLLCLVMVGGALMPDLDNTSSSAESALGFVGSILSGFMRFTAPIIQGLVHTKYDKDTETAHRGFYHTAVSAVLFGGLTAALCSIPGAIGEAVSLVLAFTGVHIALSTVAKKVLKIKSGVQGALMATVASLGAVLLLWFMLPDSSDYTSIGIAFGVGWLIHLLGDMCTTQGVPILWPIPIRGKMWWRIRLLPIKAGGVIENMVFIPLFLVVIAVSVVFMVIP